MPRTRNGTVYTVRPCDDEKGRTWDVVKITPEDRRRRGGVLQNLPGTVVAQGLASRAAARAEAARLARQHDMMA